MSTSYYFLDSTREAQLGALQSKLNKLQQKYIAIINQFLIEHPEYSDDFQRKTAAFHDTFLTPDIVPDESLIGTYHGGGRFTWTSSAFPNIQTVKKMLDENPTWRIVDEYDQAVSFEDFRSIAENKSNTKYWR